MGSLPSEAAGSSTAGLSKWGSGLQTRIRAGERRLLSNSTANYTTTSANSMVTTAATTTTTPAPSTTAKKFVVKFTVSLPYSKADFTADKQTKSRRQSLVRLVVEPQKMMLLSKSRKRVVVRARSM